MIKNGIIEEVENLSDLKNLKCFKNSWLQRDF